MTTKKRLLLVLSTIVVLLCLSVVPAFATDVKGLPEVPAPIDPQSWEFSRDMTWDDWHDNPAFDWRIDGDKITPTTVKKGLLILVDFVDKPFVVTNEKGSQQMGNPQIEGVDTEDLVEFWESFLNDPKDHFNDGLNRGVTISEFWQENTQGRWKVELDACGVYRLPGYEFEYGGLGTALPTGFTSRGSINTPSVNAAIAAGIPVSNYDFAFILHSGGAESQIWEEAGYMMFYDQYNIDYKYTVNYRMDQLRALGLEVPAAAEAWIAQHDPKNGGDGLGLWAPNQYVPWTSWWGASHLWSSTSSITLEGRSFRLSQQGETNGCATFSHEFGHISTIADNYGTNVNTRAYTGFWDLMCGGSMTGFGGNHTRYQIPNLNGGAIPAHMLTRTKLKLGFIDANQLCTVNYTALKNSTPVVTEIYSRTTPVGDQFGAIYPELEAINNKVKAGEAALGLRVNGFTDQKPRILSSVDWESDTNAGANRYDNYSIEVVDQVGYDSVQSDHGVLIAKNRETLSESAPYSWLVDAHAGGLDTVDFYTPVGPNGEPSVPKPFRNNDNNHLSAALFHAGVSVTPNDYGVEILRTGQTNETVSIVLDENGDVIPKSIADDTVNEYVDTYNGLHFYILDKLFSPGPYGGDILSYKVAVRSVDGLAVNGELAVTAGELTEAVPGMVAQQDFTITNTGDATDIIRVSASNIDFPVTLLNNLYAIKAGETVTVPVYVEIPFGLDVDNMQGQSLIFTASSETNATKTANAIISTFDLVAGGKGNLRLVTDAHLVKAGDYFRATAYFREAADSNTATVEFVFDTDKFLYRGFTPAEGVELLNTVNTPTGVKFTFMKRDYAIKSFGEVLFSAKEDMAPDKVDNDIKVAVSYVVRENGEKVVKNEVASTSFIDEPIYTPELPDLVSLSNLIDVFGMKNTHPDWNIYRYYDYNNNKMIDILDISKFASMIK